VFPRADVRFFVLALTWLEESVGERTRDCYSFTFPTIRITRRRFRGSLPD